MDQLHILHFNDVYRVKQKYSGGNGEITAAQFAQLITDTKSTWPLSKGKGKEREREGLVLFSGDVFSPSVESSVTRGSHMVPVLNELSIDVAMLGNHDFDYGYPHAHKLIKDTNFPWLLSNIVDQSTNTTPEGTQEFVILERSGTKIGVVGLVEEDWIATIPSWEPNFKYQNITERAIELSKLLREEKGCELVIALTHARLPNDVKLANETGAVSFDSLKDCHGLDIILGGHDHMYYIGRGIKNWENWTPHENFSGAEEDKSTLVIKSGTDFKDLSDFSLELTSNPSTSIRKKLIKNISGKHLLLTPEHPTSEKVEKLLTSLLADVDTALQKDVCYTLTQWNVKSELVRTEESAIGNFVSDALLHAYDKPTDAVIICGGTLRGDSIYGPGNVTLGDILEIMPFNDPVVMIELDGEGIWDCLESALSKYPSQEGRFPVVAGLEVVWDSRNPPLQRIKSIHLIKQDDDYPPSLVQLHEGPKGKQIEVQHHSHRSKEEVKRETGGRIYNVVTREYMAEGYDGFTALKDRKFIIDDEAGVLMSSIIRQLLLGSAFLWRKKQMFQANEHHQYNDEQTLHAINRQKNRTSLSPVNSPSARSDSSRATYLSFDAIDEDTTNPTLGAPHVVSNSWRTLKDALRVARREHMSDFDHQVDGNSMRKSRCENQDSTMLDVDAAQEAAWKQSADDLAVVAPMVDGRLRDLGRS